MAAYQNVDDVCDGFNLDRDQITLVRLLGTGNFGQVSKAIYGASHSEVAVKSLKGSYTLMSFGSLAVPLILDFQLSPAVPQYSSQYLLFALVAFS